MLKTTSVSVICILQSIITNDCKGCLKLGKKLCPSSHFFFILLFLLSETSIKFIGVEHRLRTLDANFIRFVFYFSVQFIIGIELILKKRKINCTRINSSRGSIFSKINLSNTNSKFTAIFSFESHI